MPLSELPPACPAVFLSCSETSIYPKLADMGLIEGSTWQVIQKMPFSGPLVISNGSSRISIRQEDARSILMQQLG
jgi:Fe2+ transport system protein FeoA